MINKNILIKPLITEKTMVNAATSRFTFQVDKTCSKKEIAKEVERQFHVKVVGVKTITLQGKAKRIGARRGKIEKKSWKKAIVQLEKDQKIDLFEIAQS